MEQSPGGLAAALRGLRGTHVWVGWPGTRRPAASTRSASASGSRADGLYPVFLSPRRKRASTAASATTRSGRSSTTCRAGSASPRTRGAATSTSTSASPTTIAEHCTPGCRVWVHDFQLMLVPEALRRRRPDVSIGFFLHIPFPSSEIYRLLPAREQVLRGLLGADYVSFHTGDYARHFRSSLLRILGIDSEPDVVEHEGRLVGIGVDPIGIDVESFHETLADPETKQRPGRDRGALRGPAADPRRRAARLHQGDPAEAAGVRALPRARPRAGEDDHHVADPRPVTAREPRVPGHAGRDRAAGGACERAVRRAGPHAGRVRPPEHHAGRAGRRSTGAPT